MPVPTNLATLDGAPLSPDAIANKVVLFVNVASACGLTPQYSGLVDLDKAYGERGLVVVGVPCNQFGAQEPGTADEIKDLTKTKDFSFIELGNQRVLFPITVDSENEDLIEVEPVKTSPGYLAGNAYPEKNEQLDKIKLPFLPTGKHRAFPIKGDSMLPVKDGSFIVGRYIEDLQDIKNGTTYVLLTKDDGMVYKRVFDQLKLKGSLLLVSDNKEYQPYDVSASDILEVWEFTCAIQTQEYNADELKISSILQMFNNIGAELSTLR